MAKNYLLVLLSACMLGACSAESQQAVAPMKVQGSPFALPIRCEQGGQLVHCLADVLKSGTQVVMLRNDGAGVCEARTAGPFVMKDHSSTNLTVTLLAGAEACTGTYRIAYLLPEKEKIQLTQLVVTNPAVSAETDTKARDLIVKAIAGCPDCGNFLPSAAAPKALAAGGYTVLAYSLKAYPKGRSLLIRDGQPIVLEGTCTDDHAFFTVNGRLHLSYSESGCDSGVYIVHVYDLSKQKPEHVYANGRLST